MDRRLQSILGDLVRICLLLPVLLVASSRGCYLEECVEAYMNETTAQPSNICQSIANAEQCIIDNNCEDVISIQSINFNKQLNEDRAANDCFATASPPCTDQLPVFNSSLSIMDLGDPIIDYKNSDSLCSPNLATAKRHCSMFTYSHVRQFSQDTIQTCSVGVLQPLIDHAQLSILVSGVTDGQSSHYTNLKEILVLVYPDECTGNQLLSYTAIASQELPVNMTNHIPGVTSGEVNVNSDRTAATILLPWMATTLVIHRYAQHLGIVVHMPVEMAESDSGLCGEGCSSDNQIDPDDYINNYCPSNQESSMLGCMSKPSLLSDFQGSTLQEQYLMACQLDVLNSLSYDVISVMSAIVTTSKLLPNNDEQSMDLSGSGTEAQPTSSTAVPSTSPQATPPPLDCTHLSNTSPDVQILPEPVTQLDPNSLTGLCASHEPKAGALRQCGMFTYSHLRPFNSDSIQTPFLPGTWVLLQYEGLLVEVTGEVDPTSSVFTKLAEVKVTLSSSIDCTAGVTLSYTASASNPLPQDITFSKPDFALFLKPVQVDSNGDSTSIQIPWLNTTLVVRRNAGYLSIVAQMPAQFLPSVEGLCNGGYPNYSPDNFDNFASEQELICADQFQQIYFDCVVHAEVFSIFNPVEGGPGFTIPFTDICRFDVLKALSYDGLSIIRAIARDLVLLWDVGVYIYPSTEPPTLPTDTTESSPSPSPTTHSTTVSTSAEIETPMVKVSPLSTSLVLVTETPTSDPGREIPSSSRTLCHTLSLILVLIALSLVLVLQ